MRYERLMTVPGVQSSPIATVAVISTGKCPPKKAARLCCL
jgi:hypothetical protein